MRGTGLKLITGGIMVMILGAFFSFVIGMTDFAKMAWAWVTGTAFDGQTIASFLRIDSGGRAILLLDRAWILTFALPIALVGIATTLSDVYEEWSQPDEVRKAKKEARQEAQAKLQSIAKSHGRSTDQSKKPMSGWRRLWIALSLVLGAPIFLIQFSEDRRGFETYSPSGEVAALEGQEFWNALFWEAREERPSLAGCIESTIEMRQSYGGFDITCNRNWLSASFPAFWFAIFPAVLMAACGLTVRWIYRGFRPQATIN